MLGHMIKRIILFLIIIALGLALYFYQSRFPKSLPAFSQTGQTVDSQKVLAGSGQTPAEKKEVSLPAPLKVNGEWLSNDKNSIILTDEGIVGFTNQERNKQSLAPLAINEKLNASAKAKVDDMFKQRYFEHTSPDGVTIDDLADQVGYDFILIGENLAEGDFKDDQALVLAWMASPHHRANILNDRYTEIGVAVGHGPLNGQDVWLAVQHFGRPANLCPDIDQALKATIDQNKATLEALSKELNLQGGEAAVFLSYIKNFNKIKTYSKLAEETSAEITQYNDQVSAFNTCI
jgi:uncharacterized protein YkwD